MPQQFQSNRFKGRKRVSNAAPPDHGAQASFKGGEATTAIVFTVYFLSLLCDAVSLRQCRGYLSHIDIVQVALQSDFTPSLRRLSAPWQSGLSVLCSVCFTIHTVPSDDTPPSSTASQSCHCQGHRVTAHNGSGGRSHCHLDWSGLEGHLLPYCHRSAKGKSSSEHSPESFANVSRLTSWYCETVLVSWLHLNMLHHKIHFCLTLYPSFCLCVCESFLRDCAHIAS